MRSESVVVSTSLPNVVDPRWGKHLVLVLKVASAVDSLQRRRALLVLSLSTGRTVE